MIKGYYKDENLEDLNIKDYEYTPAIIENFYQSSNSFTEFKEYINKK